jgi:ABC-type methionine transport system permease subunit
MSTVFLVLFAVSLAAVVISLFAGLFIMTRPGDANRRRSNYLMRARIASQVGAVGFLILFVVTK